MKTILYISIIVFIFFYLSDTKINFSPFQIHLERWRSGLAWVFFSLGILFITEDSQIIGYKKCEKDVMEIIEKIENGNSNKPDSINQTEDSNTQSSTISL